MGIFKKEIWQLTQNKLVTLYQHDSFSKHFWTKKSKKKKWMKFSVQAKKVTAPKPISKLDLGFGRTLDTNVTPN